MRFTFYIVILAILPLAGHTQENCPAAINSGTWDTWLAGIGTGRVSGGNFLNFVQSQPASARGEAHIDASACDGSFILEMPNHRFIMEATDPDSAGAGQEFTGTTNAHGMNWSMTLQRLSDSQLAGGFEAGTGSGGISINVGVTGLGMQYQQSLAELPLICHCRTHLETFIEDRLFSSQTFRDAFANRDYRRRPENWPPPSDPSFDLWQKKTYQRVIDLIVLGKSYQDAVDRVLENTDPLSGNRISDQDYIPDPGSTSSSESDSGGTDEPQNESVQSAYTDAGCIIHPGDEHLSTCYPEIALESTMMHESVHRAICLAGRPRQGINEFADEEVRGYDTEIYWLENWIREKCEG